MRIVGRLGEGKKAVKGGGRVWRDKRECVNSGKLSSQRKIIGDPNPDRNKWRGRERKRPKMVEDGGGSRVGG